MRQNISHLPLAELRGVLLDRPVEQAFERGGTFDFSAASADDAAAEYIKDGIDIEIAPLGRAFQLGDVPNPDLIAAVAGSSGLSSTGRRNTRRCSHTSW